MEENKTQVLAYAGQELDRYLSRMDPDGWKKAAIGLKVCPDLAATGQPGLDDAFHIEVNRGKGQIMGNNEGALLIGVYRFLHRLGCRFIRPGADGERVPRLPWTEWTVRCQEMAAHRHRGVVIEGANSLGQVLDFIDWMPKIGLNSFFTQFTDFRLFFQRYYQHIHHPARQPEVVDDARYKQMEAAVIQRLKGRGLMHHAVGHGWTCQCLGVQGRDWHPVAEEPSQDIRPLLAEVNGTRGFYHQVPTETNLCYSNPQARKRMLDYVVEYLDAHPGIDYLHLWLADAPHSFCQCGECMKKTPSDWYVVLLNELDARLSAEKINTRVVFLLYFDLMWPPREERLLNPGRFTMMLAPITRSFEHSFSQMEEGVQVEEYQLDATPIPRDISSMFALFRGWQDIFGGDAFDFDYYQGRAHYGDPGYMKISQVIADDVGHLKKVGLNGLLSCQELRAFFPTALPDYILAAKLWDPSQDVQALKEEYAAAAFGRRWRLCVEYLEELSRNAPIDYWYSYCPAPDKEAGEAASMAEEAAYRFAQKLEKLEMGEEDACIRLSWFYVRHHAVYARLWMGVLAARAKGDREREAACWEELEQYLQDNDQALERVFDSFRFLDLGKTAGFGTK